MRGIHTYDLDYGRQAGGPESDYSGRVGWPTGVREEPARPRERGAWYGGAWYGGPSYRGAWYRGEWYGGAWYGGPYRGAWYEEPTARRRGWLLEREEGHHWAAAEPSRYIRHRRTRRGGGRRGRG